MSLQLPEVLMREIVRDDLNVGDLILKEEFERIGRDLHNARHLVAACIWLW